MKKAVDSEFKEICQSIINMNKKEDEWKLIESSDMYQTVNYCGGYDATEGAFCFSYYDKGEEFWFQLTLNEIKEIAENTKDIFEIHPADL